MKPKDTRSSEDAVVVVTQIAAPIERVFRALTDPKQLFQWWGAEPSVELTAFEMDPRPGGRWHFTCKPRPGHPQGEVAEQMRATGASQYEAHGEVLEYEPPRLLAWSWIANWHDRPEERTVVRWELEPKPPGTRVSVTHSGLTRLPVARKDYGTGWEGVLRLLREFNERA